MAGLPVVASAIPGSIGLLGSDYPGYYPVEETQVLRELLLQAESDAEFYARLQEACEHRRYLFSEQAELRGWSDLLEELATRK
jgi:glycosyltransferase involved in cell wall biosynthesis